MKRLKSVWLRNQVKPLVAWRAMRELLKNPDDTTQVFHIIEALKGDSLGAAASPTSVASGGATGGRPSRPPITGSQDTLPGGQPL